MNNRNMICQFVRFDGLERANIKVVQEINY